MVSTSAPTSPSGRPRHRGGVLRPLVDRPWRGPGPGEGRHANATSWNTSGTRPSPNRMVGPNGAGSTTPGSPRRPVRDHRADHAGDRRPVGGRRRGEPRMRTAASESTPTARPGRTCAHLGDTIFGHWEPERGRGRGGIRRRRGDVLRHGRDAVGREHGSTPLRRAAHRRPAARALAAPRGSGRNRPNGLIVAQERGVRAAPSCRGWRHRTSGTGARRHRRVLGAPVADR